MKYLLLFALLLLGCSRLQYILVGTSLVPGAQGRLDLEPIEGHQRLATLELEHLPRPERVRPEAQHYAVWIGRNAEPAVVRTTLPYNEARRGGIVMLEVPGEAFRLYVTVESTATPTSLDGQRVVLDRYVGEQ